MFREQIDDFVQAGAEKRIVGEGRARCLARPPVDLLISDKVDAEAALVEVVFSPLSPPGVFALVASRGLEQDGGDPFVEEGILGGLADEGGEAPCLA